MIKNREEISMLKFRQALQVIRMNKNAGDDKIHPLLTAAYKELKGQSKSKEVDLMFQRVLLHIGDVSREHHLLKRMGIKSQSGGAQERVNFRSIMRWWEKNLPEQFYSYSTLEAIYEFTVAENLIYNEIRTDRKKGNVLSVEFMDFDKKKIVKFIAHMITSGKNVELWAKHLPKADFSKYRTTVKSMKIRKSLQEKGVKEFNWTLPFDVPINKVKLNGSVIDSSIVKEKDGKASITVRDGDKVAYPRKKQTVTLERQKRDLEFVKLLSKELNFEEVEKEHDGTQYTDFVGYKKFRSKQNTFQQKIQTGEVFDLSKDQFKLVYSKLTAATQFRVAKMIAYKDESGNIKAKEGKWNKLGNYYIEWVKEQEKVAQELREAAKNNDSEAKAKAMKKMKTKVTGLQTIDLLAETVKPNLTNAQINNAYEALVAKMDLIANVFPVIDGSGSMFTSFEYYSRWNRGFQIDDKHKNIQVFDVAAAMLIAFSTRNPNPEFRNIFGWFSYDFKIIGDSKYKDTRPNKHLQSDEYIQKGSRFKVLSETNTFTQNLNNIKQANPGDKASTNIMSIIDHFVKLIDKGTHNPEDLPQAILILTDNQGNTGKSPKEALQIANSKGWNPLIIYWGLIANPMTQYEGIPNTLFLGGFNESILSQVLRGISKGAINPDDEIWAIHDDPRYSVIS